jgi:molybdate transport system permease protein
VLFRAVLYGAALVAMVAVAFAFILLPLLSLFLKTTPEAFFGSFDEPVVIKALTLSLVTATCSTALVLLFGTPVAYLLSHRQFRGKAFLETAIDMTVVLPPAVAGLGLLMAFGRMGTVGEYLYPLGIKLPFTTLAVIMAQVFVSSPFYIRQARVSLRDVNKEYEEAARTLGSSKLHTFFRITLPLASAGLISGAIMAWARALGEFGATIMFAGNLSGRTQNMPLAIYTTMETDISAAIALSIILVIVSFAVMATVRMLSRRMTYDSRN